MKVTAPKDFPDHHDAELVLRLYELRRESVLRASRETITREFWPRSVEEVQAVIAWDHPMNTAFRQVVGYWELAYGLGRHGIVHAEYLAEASGGEALILYAKLAPFLAELRESAGARFLRNIEWIATETETGRELVARMTPRVEAMRDQRASG
ncbi:MAG: hypothetical protein AB7R55_21600 [Gemmatimonadales bacterium]